jgi:hypothetical protein
VKPYLKKTHHKKGLVDWLKVKALNSNPSTVKKKKKKDTKVLKLTQPNRKTACNPST